MLHKMITTYHNKNKPGANKVKNKAKANSGAEQYGGAMWES